MDRELVWTVSRDADGTFRLTESSERHGPFTLVTCSDQGSFYRMVALRKLRAEDKGLDIAFHDTTADINKSGSHEDDWDGATMSVGSN